MKKLLVIIFCAFSISSAFSQINFIPYWEAHGELLFKKDSPYIGGGVETDLGFELSIFQEAYFSGSFTLSLGENPVDYLYPNTKGRGDIVKAKLNGAVLGFPNILNKNVYLTLFYGGYDELNSDKLLIEITKAKMKSSFFYASYPTSVFKPPLKIDGVGTAIYGELSHLPFYLAGYLYWNGIPETSGSPICELSTDFRFGYTFPSGSFNGFLGFTFPIKDIKKAYMRAGFSGMFLTPQGYEFYFDFGVHNLGFAKITTEELLQKVYLLFEPCIKFDLFRLSIPFFLSQPNNLPGWGNEPKIDSIVGFGLNVAGGDLDVKNFEGGLGFYVGINPNKPTEFDKYSMAISPFFSYGFLNYCLDTRVNLYPGAFPTWQNMVSISIQLKAVH